MPNKIRVKVEGIFRDEQESNAAPAGENLRLRISGMGLHPQAGA
jgi:peptide chain release factor subunit 3